MTTKQSMGITDGKAAASLPASSEKAAPTAGGVTAAGVLLKFSKEDLVYLATGSETKAIRLAAAEALYHRGRTDAANEIGAAMGARS